MRYRQGRYRIMEKDIESLANILYCLGEIAEIAFPNRDGIRQAKFALEDGSLSVDEFFEDRRLSGEIGRMC